MMINKRLIGAVPESKKYIAGNVALQWCSLCANIAMMSAVTALLAALFAGSMTQSKIVTTAVIALAVDPARQTDSRTSIGGAERAAGMGAVGVHYESI